MVHREEGLSRGGHLRMVAVAQAGKGTLTPRQQGCRSASTLVRKVECGWSVGCWGHFFLGMGQRPGHAGLECHAKSSGPEATVRTSMGFKAGAPPVLQLYPLFPLQLPRGSPPRGSQQRNHRAPPAGADGKGSKTGVRSGGTEGSNHKSVSVAWWGNHGLGGGEVPWAD